ncbi:hypothetical protein Tco_1301329 [Tanacetum coccineum]
MAFGSQTVGDVVVPKFDMHVYTSVLTSDEVKSLVAEYVIPLDLHPCIPPSGMTMNRLPADKIGLNRLTMFEIYCRNLEINPSVNLFCAFYKLNKQGHWFSFERRLGKQGQGKIFNEFCMNLKHWKDRFFCIDHRAKEIRWLCENVIDLHPVHPAMLYAVGLTTVWKHVGHHPVFKDGEGTVATSMSQFLKFPMAGGVRVGKGTALAANEAIPQHTTPPLPSGTQIPEKSDHQKVFEYENERVLAGKRKAQAAKDRAVGKRAATEGTSRRTKKKKTAPLSFALSDSEADGSNRSGFNTHHSASPLNIIIPNKAELTTGEDTTKVNSPLSEPSNPSDEDAHHTRDETTHTHAFGSTGRVSSSSGGSHHQAFPRRNLGGSRIGSSLRGDTDLPAPFVPAWSLTTHSILNDVESCRDMMIHLATPAAQDQQNRLSDYQALQRSWFKLGRGSLAQIDILRRDEALNEDYGELCVSHRCIWVVSKRRRILLKMLAVVEKERDDLLDKDREREERIRQLEADLASKTSSLTDSDGVVITLKGDLERLTVDLSHAEIVRHNCVRQLLPIVFQRLLSNDEYKKSLSDVFNLAIVAGWSEGVKAACSEEEAEAFLATAADYDPACKTTFMSVFDSLFNKSYPYVEKLAESFRLPLGDLQNMWPEGTGPTPSGNAVDM